jgi:hypothetical protein
MIATPVLMLSEITNPSFGGIAIPMDAIFQFKAVDFRILVLVELDLGDNLAVLLCDLLDLPEVACNRPKILPVDCEPMRAPRRSKGSGAMTR